MKEIPVRTLITSGEPGESPRIVPIMVPQFLITELANRIRARSNIALPINCKFDIVVTTPKGWVVPQ